MPKIALGFANVKHSLDIWPLPAWHLSQAGSGIVLGDRGCRLDLLRRLGAVRVEGDHVEDMATRGLQGHGLDRIGSRVEPERRALPLATALPDEHAAACDRGDDVGV